MPATETVYISGSGGNINVYSLDTTTGQLSVASNNNVGMNPSYMAFSHDNKYAYAVNEADPPNSNVLAFSINETTGALTAIGAPVATGAAGSPHLAVHPNGKWLVVAHYGTVAESYVGGQTTVLPINTDGTLGAAGTPNRGPSDSCKNAHQIIFDAAGTHLFVPCLGSNQIIQYLFDPATGVLAYNDPGSVSVPGGPRHFALDPTEKHGYLLTEEDSTIVWFDYDASTGKLSNAQTISSVSSDGNKGSSAHILIHPTGKWLYASNRYENTLGKWSLDAQGVPSSPTFVMNTAQTPIDTPRDFSIDPSGHLLVLASERGTQDALVFRIDQSTGELTVTQSLPVGNGPACVKALILP